ncbi:hypothetical protein PITCH_A2200006 [uncultured Desulfobacterium sp.]|uniref:THIF-type NAD/FAD binding fold domain-containing protein n=1 Tax=uncultured Desulfobacterium sp. TaxID=201089 RepID=A0A445MXT5_9BACT|nr:hypothetical protein PITCH_A2200006 [uncultured Desulfobacterium sp.]
MEEIIQEINELRQLPYVYDDDSFSFDRKNGYIYVSLSIRVDLPAKGPVNDVRTIEPVIIVLPPDFPKNYPRVFLKRDDFPPVHHLTRRPGDFWGEICLTRQPAPDWWHGKTLGNAVLAAYKWLTDAAAGELVKKDDPFEPLIVDGRNPVVEVDFDIARKEARKNGGVWDTSAHQIIVPNLAEVRFIIGSGDVPTRLWYQAHLQATPWSVVPVDLDGVLELASTIGLKKEKVRYWIEKGGTKSNRVLTVFGVKRPKLVLGQAGTEEWVAFDFHRENQRDKWTVTSHLVLRRFDQDFARSLSGFGHIREQKKVLVLGAGAFGSTICELLARSGMVDLTIIDNDTLRPYNLARHTLTGKEIGQPKAIAVADRLNSVFVTKNVAFGIFKNFLDLSDEEIREQLNGVECILDLSASVAVQNRIALIPDRQIPLVSAFQILSGKGTMALVEDFNIRGRADIIEAAMMMREREDPVIAGWLTEKIEPLAIGGGCSSGSARIPDALVKIGAAWVANAVLYWLSSKEWPLKPMYGIQRNSFDPNPIIETEWKQVETEPIAKTIAGWSAFVLTSVINDLNRFAQNAGTAETGGILVGRVNRQSKVLPHRTFVWVPPICCGRIIVFLTGMS